MRGTVGRGRQELLIQVNDTFCQFLAKIDDSGNVDNKGLCSEKQNKFSQKKYFQ